LFDSSNELYLEVTRHGIHDEHRHANCTAPLEPPLRPCLERTKPGQVGLIRPDKIKRLNVCVSKESIQRAMLIWDRILKAVEAGTVFDVDQDLRNIRHNAAVYSP